MDVYLLDTNHLIPFLKAENPKRAAIVAKLSALPPESHVCVATATLAELEVGCASTTANRAVAQAEIRSVIAANKLVVLPFTEHTAAEYGAIKAALMRQYDRAGRKKAAKWPEGWAKPTNGEKLGADELDMIVVSHAVERNMVLVTNDGMERIIDALKLAGIQVRPENWLGP